MEQGTGKGRNVEIITQYNAQPLHLIFTLSRRFTINELIKKLAISSTSKKVAVELSRKAMERLMLLHEAQVNWLGRIISVC